MKCGPFRKPHSSATDLTTPQVIVGPTRRTPPMNLPLVLVSEPTEGEPELTDVVPETMDVAPEQIDVVPEPMDVVPRPMDGGKDQEGAGPHGQAPLGGGEQPLQPEVGHSIRYLVLGTYCRFIGTRYLPGTGAGYRKIQYRVRSGIGTCNMDV